MEKLVEMYEKGAITADHLATETLQCLDPDHPAVVLEPLPKEVRLRILQYARQFRPGAMRTNYGLQPAPDQVLAAKQWIEANETNGDCDARANLGSDSVKPC